METNVNSFFDALSTDRHLQNVAAMSQDPEALAELAVTRGFAVSPADIRAALGEDLEVEGLHTKSLGWGVAYLSFMPLPR